MIDHCFISNKEFDKDVKFYDDPEFNGYKYYFKPVGIVHITSTAVTVIEKNTFNLSILAGLCRCAFELNEKPPVIDSVLLNSLDTLKNIPRGFNEKYHHFLSLLFKTGGNEYKPRNIDVENDYPLAFANDIYEFQRIIDFGIKTHDLECLKSFETEDRGVIFYIDLNFTPAGLKKMNKIVNNYFSIVQPKIDSGDLDLDKKINHAYSLFSQENPTIEDKRSACEELAFLLEGLKKDLTEYFTDKDVKIFFQLVNEFDIRHNKEHTKRLVYEEQVEWIFLSLLNTILTYIKLKKRFK